MAGWITLLFLYGLSFKSDLIPFCMRRKDSNIIYFYTKYIFLFAEVNVWAVVFGLWLMLILKIPVAGTYSKSISDSRILFITFSASLFLKSLDDLKV